MEIVRYVNGNEITKEELYERKLVTEEMRSAINDVRSRLYTVENSDDKRSQK